ncbi:GNAT family N-acetyltransferase [Polaribacter uvawellassae]|uniref:GNAT family N-acetyltransferase n=1 Tax=Polaribacter uvawellassae TaxID=3133495 RepID=UPI00321AF2C8
MKEQILKWKKNFKISKKMVTIKKATKADTIHLSLLSRVTYTESHGHFIANKKDLLKYCKQAFSIKKTLGDLEDKNNIFHIAYVDDFPVGYSKIVLNKPFEEKTENNSCRLERIYILNDFIPVKIGQPFLDYITEKVKEYNATIMWLSVYIKNERGIRFYQKNKFKNIGEISFKVNGKEYDNIVFSKEI